MTASTPTTSDERASTGAHGPGRLRMCALTRERLPEARLIRFVLGPDGALVPDLAERLPGRGVWVRAERQVVLKALKAGAFARGLKAGVRVEPGLVEALERMLARRCVELLGLGRRAGAIVAGMTACADAIRVRSAARLVSAADAGADGRRKLEALWLGVYGARTQSACPLTAAEIGVAFDRERVVHACWLQDRMAGLWAVASDRLAGFREVEVELAPAEGFAASGGDRVDGDGG